MAEPDLDLAFLSRQVFGDPDLVRELLGLFRQQCERLGPALDTEGAALARAEAAHTLRGAALAIGARRIAEATGRLEVALGPEEIEAARGDLRLAIAAALAAVDDHLRAGAPSAWAG